MSEKHLNRGYLLAFGSAAAGAVRYNLAVFAKVEYRFDYVAFLAYALLVGLVASGVHVVLREGWRGFVPLKGRIHHALLYGALMGWSTLAHFLALDYLNETLMTSLGQTGILVSLGLAAWLLHERLSRQEWAATLVILVGVFVFKPWQAGHRTGFLILTSGVVCGSLASVGAKRWVQGTSPQVLMVWRNLVAFVLVLSAALLLNRSAPVFQTETAVACVLTGILGPYLHGLFFLQALQYISASRATLMGRVQPVIVFAVSYLVLSRAPARAETLSALVLTLGTFWLIWARPKTRA